jgi:hypothetical protein
VIGLASHSVGPLTIHAQVADVGPNRSRGEVGVRRSGPVARRGFLLALTVSLAALACAPASAVASVAEPPELARLVQASRELQIKTLRFSASFEERLAIGSTPKSSKRTIAPPFDLFVDATGVAQMSPRLVELHYDALGQSGEQRIIGNSSYVHEPAASSPPGKRADPWVRSTIAPAAPTTEPILLFGGLLGGSGSGSGAQSPGEEVFGSLPLMLEDASSVTDVGPEYVNGQQAIEFEIALAPSAISGKLAKAVEQLRAKPPADEAALARIGLFFAPDGLPVRTNWTVGIGTLSISSSAEILATEVPVKVEAPPRSNTISAAEQKRTEAIQRRRLRREARRGRGVAPIPR